MPGDQQTLPVFLHQIEAVPLHEIGSAQEAGERHAEQIEAMKQSAQLAVNGVAVQVESQFALFDAIDRQAQTTRLAVELLDDGRHAGAGRRLADAIAGQHFVNQAQQQLAPRCRSRP